jgi:hypothetical protein
VNINQIGNPACFNTLYDTGSNKFPRQVMLATEIEGVGCIVRSIITSNQFATPLETMVFVPGVMIQDDVDCGKKLVKSVLQGIEFVSVDAKDYVSRSSLET